MQYGPSRVGFVAMTKHGPPRAVLDSRLRGNDMREVQEKISCREFVGVPRFFFSFLP